MSKSANTVEIDRIRISSFAAPSDEDLALLASLSDDEKAALLRREVLKGSRSGWSGRTMEEIWQEALRRSGRAPGDAI